MVDILCAIIYCFGMFAIAGGLHKLAELKIKIVFPKITVEKERARLDGDYKFTVEQRLQ